MLTVLTKSDHVGSNKERTFPKWRSTKNPVKQVNKQKWKSGMESRISRCHFSKSQAKHSHWPWHHGKSWFYDEKRIKGYSCTKCEYATKKRHNMKEHVEGLEYPCNSCAKVFRSSNSFRNHERRCVKSLNNHWIKSLFQNQWQLLFSKRHVDRYKPEFKIKF